MADTVCGMTRGFFVRRAKKPQEYFVYFKVLRRRRAKNTPSDRAPEQTESAANKKRQFETILSENKTMECKKNEKNDNA